MEGPSAVSPDVVARYAGDAALEVEGVAAVAAGVRKGVRVEGEVDTLELHLSFRYGVSIPEVGAAVQQHVIDYLGRMTDVRPAVVNVVVDEIDGS